MSSVTLCVMIGCMETTLNHINATTAELGPGMNVVGAGRVERVDIGSNGLARVWFGASVYADVAVDASHIIDWDDASLHLALKDR